ncbi:polyphosphate:AMP phosphotransferase [Sporomusa malonica]|uniref:Polyphosphate:AMP phosphotransferase n=1 Tax=Sporomusa malonica TaxID=112901 RepID=A0A1W2C1U8_9FIRM|nr:polyphosphate:AMP phosphotransferase [Sporomusa malonica]SMC79071.1 polyphosphate:AMP phosphotransferase [Sporomusa malonica]
MLEKVDLKKKISKAEYKEMIDRLSERLGELQRQARDLGIPVLILFEGWDAAGKGTLINELILTLDPRGFNVYSIGEPNEEAVMRPYFWRFWNKTPRCGRMVILDRSWYTKILNDRVDKSASPQEIQKVFHNSLSFERQLSDDGTLIIKFFLHISEKEQRKRLEKLEQDPATAWRVTEADWEHHRQYNKYLLAIEDMLQQTDAECAAWTIIEAHDRRYAALKIIATVIEAMEKRIAVAQAELEAKNTISVDKPLAGSGLSKIFTSSILAGVDLTKNIKDAEYESSMKLYQSRVRELEHIIYNKRIPVIIAFEGWDAAGKGGAIRRLTQHMDPRGYTVIPISAPTEEEKAHHYLWRFWRNVPKAGHIAIFDRSWYGRVLVERVEGFCRESHWRQAYKEINEMEEQWANFGAVLIKFWLHIDKEEQKRRFEERMANPGKQWKITGEDWRNREKWELYEKAVDEMFFRTSTTYAPWTLVEANSKEYARKKVIQTVVEAIERKLDD